MIVLVSDRMMEALRQLGEASGDTGRLTSLDDIIQVFEDQGEANCHVIIVNKIVLVCKILHCIMMRVVQCSDREMGRSGKERWERGEETGRRERGEKETSGKRRE